jgi:hypothetical protein
MDTEYKFVAKPAKPIGDDIKVSYTDNPIDLSQLLIDGGNPFLSNGGSAADKAPAEIKEKVVTSENWVTGDPVPHGFKVSDGKLVKGVPF